MKKKIAIVTFCLLGSFFAFAQNDIKTQQDNARAFMRSGDYNNAILILTRALEENKNNLELQKDLAMSHYLKRDYVKAKEVAKILTDRDDADEITYQIAGNVYKALEEVKECDKMYKKALKKFPTSGPLLSEYGELLWATKNFSAINYWEKGIQVDPSYAGNYYNAAMHYFHTKDKVWSIIYGEIFINMESLSERGAAMKTMLLDSYKEKLFAEFDLMKGEEKNKSEFAKAFLQTMNKQSTVANKGLSIDALTMIRTRFLLDWDKDYASRFPSRLFDFHRQLLQDGLFDAYNQWLFGPVINLVAYENWTKTHAEDYTKFTNLQKSRVFKIPAGQYYQVN